MRNPRLPSILAARGVFALVAVATMLLVACGGGKSSSATATPAPSGTAGAAAATPVAAGDAGTCGPAASAIASIPRKNTRKFDAAPKRMIDPAKKYIVTMKTGKGQITLELDAANAPNTVNNFVFLSCSGFYDGLTFHRVVKTPTPFVIQGGDPRGDGTGGPGYIFDNEISPKITHVAGAISMANSGPNTNGSQFFITLSVQPVLDGSYNVFGHVTDGMTVVNAIAVSDKIISVSVQEQ